MRTGTKISAVLVALMALYGAMGCTVSSKEKEMTSMLFEVLEEDAACDAIHEGICISDPDYNIEKYINLINGFIENAEKRAINAPILFIKKTSSDSTGETFHVVTGHFERTSEERIAGATQDFKVTVTDGTMMVLNQEVRMYDPE